MKIIFNYNLLNLQTLNFLYLFCSYKIIVANYYIFKLILLIIEL